MAKSVLSADHFHDEAAAVAFIEARIWPNGPVCPHCGENARLGRLNAKGFKLGMWKCYACRKKFAVTVGTVMESSHIPLRVWLQGMHLMCSSKKGFSANQLHRILGITLKSAWFLGHRIRHHGIAHKWRLCPQLIVNVCHKRLLRSRRLNAAKHLLILEGFERLLYGIKSPEFCTADQGKLLKQLVHICSQSIEHSRVGGIG